MARPPKNAEGPSATQRMELAFWDCMKEMPYSDIVVRDIVDRAKVNRNSYYYHYDSMWDLAQASVKHAKFTDLARLLMSQKTFNPESPAREFSEEAEHGFEMLQILSSENGNQRLLESAKVIITEEWLAMFGCENVLISKRTETEIDFVFGGITAMLAGPNISNLEGLVDCIASSELLLETIKTMRQIIRACEPEKIEKAVAALHRTHEIEAEKEEEALQDSAKVSEGNGEISSSSVNDNPEDVESLVDRIIKEELNSEQLREEESGSEAISIQEPVNTEETQQETEAENEAVSTQILDRESNYESVLSSEENIDFVSADDEAQEAAARAEYRQEPVETTYVESVSVTEIVIEETIEEVSVQEDVVDETDDFEAEARSIVEEIEQATQSESAQTRDDEHEEDQLSLDFLF